MDISLSPIHGCGLLPNVARILPLPLTRRSLHHHPLLLPLPPNTHALPLYFCQLTSYPVFLALIKWHVCLKSIFITPNKRAVRLTKRKDMDLKQKNSNGTTVLPVFKMGNLALYNTGVGCHFLLQCMKVKSESEVAQSCPTLCDPMDSLPGSSVHAIFQARVLEWGAIAFSEGDITSS